MSDSSNNTTDSSNNVTDSSNNVTDSSNNVTDSSCNCYQLFVLDASGGFTIQQNLQDVSLNEQIPLALYDISSAIQIRLGVRSLNSALGIEKDDANRNVVQTTYDASSEMFSPNDLSYNTTTLLESISEESILNIGRMSTLYSDFNYTVEKYFGLPAGFSDLFAEEHARTLNNGVFDISGLYSIMTGNNFNIQGSYVSDLSGAFFIDNMSEKFRYLVDTDIFNNRHSAGYGVADGFIENDLIYLSDGITVTLRVNIEEEAYSPKNNIGPTNLQAVDASINYFDASNNVRKVTTYSTTNITQSYTVPILFILTSDDVFNPEDYGHEWVDVTTGLLVPQKWLAVSISIDGKYQTAIEELGDIYISSNFGQSWTISTNIGREVSNSVAISTSGQYQTASNGKNIYISSDYGSTWTNVFSYGQADFFVAISLNGQYQTLISAGDAMYRSTDYGLTWNKFSDDTHDLYYSVLGFPTGGVTMSYDGKYQTIVSENIYYSSDYGVTWTTTTDINTNDQRDWDDHNWMGVDMSSDGHYQSAVEVTGEIYVSVDYGITWDKIDKPIVTDKQWQGISVSASGQYQTAIVKGGTIYVSIDYGQNWEESEDTEVDNRQWQAISVSSSGIYQTAAVYNGSLWTSNLV